MSRPPPSGTLIIIPARLGSIRFPAKVLALLGGLPVVEWCRRAAVRAGIGPVVVATDHRRVREVVTRCGGSAVLTPASCRSGSDRCYAALCGLERTRRRRFSRIINLQGDEPFIRPAVIRAAAKLLGAPSKPDITTAVVRIQDPKRARDPNVVKAALARDGRCLYFSRAPVPHVNGSGGVYYQHIGIYGYSRAALERFVGLKASPLERTERLEQLRALEDGMTIYAARVNGETTAIDTRSDLRRAQRLVRRLKITYNYEERSPRSCGPP